MNAQPLSDVRVLDFSTLLPGPLCSLLLAEAGAEVTKVERPGSGDEMRTYEPRLGDCSANFALLNRGKKSVALDLKSEQGRARVLELVAGTDVLIEQFRPGVMDRLGLGREALRRLHPRLVYCSITGYGQHGPMADKAGHDLNFAADAGVLSLCASGQGEPGLPHALLADIGGGAYPAFMNILLALRTRERTGEGCALDIGMAENLFTFMYWGLGSGWAAGQWPRPGRELVTGGSPRYQLYRTGDGHWLACAPIEDRFWKNFLRVLGAPDLEQDDSDPEAVRAAVAAIIARDAASTWLARFEGVDACVNRVLGLDEACAHAHFASRGVFDGRLGDGHGRSIPSLPLPIAGMFRATDGVKTAPALGSAT